MDEARLQHALELIEQADLLVVGAGAGMGVDSGLPDFRGSAGFWRAYPALAKAGIDFCAAANPRRFAEAPREAWGFYGHRLNLYRKTRPHAGFEILARWGGTQRAWADRLHQQCGRPVPKRRLCRRRDLGVPWLADAFAVHAALQRGGLAGRRVRA